MKIVLDTNVLLTIISERASLHEIFIAFLDEKYILCVTTDILNEYEEVIGRHMGKDVADNIMKVIENAINVEYVIKYYKWQLIQIDPDDNKFVDCAITSNAKYIVTGDKHFNILKDIPFPKVEIIDAYSFINELNTEF
jgi:uncharacterized protein